MLQCEYKKPNDDGGGACVNCCGVCICYWK